MGKILRVMFQGLFFLLSFSLVASLTACSGGGGGGGGSSSETSTTPVDNTPRFAYAINSLVIAGYVVDPESGNLIPKGNSQRFFETSPTDIAVRPDGRFLYFSDVSEQAIKRRQIDPQTGVFSPDGADFPVGAPGAQQIAMHPSGKFLFYRKDGSNPVTTLALDPVTGDMSLVSETAPLNTSGMYLAPNGKFLYTTFDGGGGKEIQTFRVGADGSLAIVDADPATSGEQPQTFANVTEPGINPANGDIYLVNLAGAGSVDRYARDTSSGLLTFVDSTPLPSGTPSYFSGMHVEPLGRFGYIRLSGNLIAGFSIDPGDGTLTPIDFDPGTAGIQHLDFGPLANSISCVSFEPSGHFVYFGFTGGVATLEKYAVDQTTGALSQSTSKPELNQVLGLPGANGVVFTNRTGIAAPQPTFAYSRQTGQIGIHRVDPVTGMLADIGTFATPAQYWGLYADPAQQFMYLAEVSAYARVRIDQGTGALSDRETSANATPDAFGPGEQGLRFDPHNRFAVQTKQNGSGMDLMEVVATGLAPSKTAVQFTQDPYTVTGTQGASAVRPNSRQLYSTGLVAGSAPNFFWVMRVFNLVATPVSFDRVDLDPATAGQQDLPLSGSASDTVVEPLGRYLLNLEIRSFGVGGTTNTDNLAVYELDWMTGLPTLRNVLTYPVVVRNYTTGSNPLQIALDPRGRFIYVPTDNGIAAFSFTRNATGPALEAIDADPGTPATIELFQTLGGSGKVVIDPTGQWLYTLGSGGTEGFRIDQTTGGLTSIGIVSPQNIVQVIGRL